MPVAVGAHVIETVRTSSPGPTPERAQGERDRVRPVRDADRARGAAEGGPLGLERGDLAPEDVAPAAHGGEDRGGELGLVAFGGPREVEVRDAAHAAPDAPARPRARGRRRAACRAVTWISHQSRRMFTPVAKSRRKLKNWDFPATRW